MQEKWRAIINGVKKDMFLKIAPDLRRVDALDASRWGTLSVTAKERPMRADKRYGRKFYLRQSYLKNNDAYTPNKSRGRPGFTRFNEASGKRNRGRRDGGKRTIQKRR